MPDYNAQMQAAQAQMEHQYKNMLLDGIGMPSASVESEHSLAKKMLLQRLNGFGPTWMRSKDFLMCHVIDETVAVFYCFGKDTGVVEDTRDLFPSDGLVAQLRILRG